MDFISIASSLDHPERRLRQLVETVLGSNDNHTMATNVTTSSSSSSGMKHKPLLSPAAEAELFMLATNFLLCTYIYLFMNGSLDIHMKISFFHVCTYVRIHFCFLLFYG